jgi:outer membrane protein
LVTNHKSQINHFFWIALLSVSPALAQSVNGSLPVLSVGEIMRSALRQNPDLLDSRDAVISAQVNERGVASSYVPQVTPFFNSDRDAETGFRTRSYGLTASQQFLFGPLLEGSATVTRSDVAVDPTQPYASDLRLSLTQNLLRGLDPATVGEPLREAKRGTSTASRSFEISRRRTVLSVYQAYLGVARQMETLRIARERAERARQLTEVSRGRFQAGTLSRLDVLRAEQQEASTELAVNDALNLLEDFRDALRRVAGFPRDLEFDIREAAELPATEPDLGGAVDNVMNLRPEAQEARDIVVDAEFALRIARSNQLPSVQGIVTYESFSTGSSVSDSLHIRNPSVFFGLRSQYGLNTTLLYSQRREAEITLESRRRNLKLLEDDFVREVRRAYRQLDALKRDYSIAEANKKVAELQYEVAQLRFEKGLSDNFNVVDAENLLNSTRLLEVGSRFDILLARLDCLFSSGQLEVLPFIQQP